MTIRRELIPVSTDRFFSYKIDLDVWPVWHHHPEIDILLFLKNTGHHVTGDFIGTFEPGSIFFNSPSIPHGFTPNEPDEGDPENPSTIAIQFSEESIGREFLGKSEMRLISDFLRSTLLSCEFLGKTRRNAAEIMQRMADERGAKLLISFIALLELLASAPDEDKRALVSPQYRPVLNEKNINRIETVRRWIMNNLTDTVTLEKAAQQIQMNPKSFSYFFKKNTGRPFVQYVAQLRVGHACQMLISTDRSILDISGASGFKNLSNFNRRFRDQKGMTPKDYRRTYSELRPPRAQ